MSEGQRGAFLVANIKFIMEEQIKILGKNVTDRVTGLEGIVTGIVFYLDGPAEVLIETRTVENKKPVSKWIKYSRITRII